MENSGSIFVNAIQSYFFSKNDLILWEGSDKEKNCKMKKVLNYFKDRPHCNSIIGIQLSTKGRNGNKRDSGPKGYSPNTNLYPVKNLNVSDLS